MLTPQVECSKPLMKAEKEHSMATLNVKRSWIRERKQVFQLSNVSDLRRRYDRARKEELKSIGGDAEANLRLAARTDAAYHMLQDARGF